MTGRTHTLDAVGDDVTAVRIISDVEHGHVTVNPDGTLALVMTGETYTGSQSFRYEATHADGSTTTHTVNMRCVEGDQAAGWATGTSHYMLETDENDNVVVEAGENHTKVYVSGSGDALSLADIARAEGMDVSQVTGEWLLANGTYGQSEGLALAEDAGMALWHAATPRGSETSNWLLFERGYTYDDLGRVMIRDTDGEDPLHPLYVGAYGSGDKPILTEEFLQNNEGSTNLVVQGLEFRGGVFFAQAGGNIIFDDISVKYVEMDVMHQDGVTVRNSDFTDVHNEAPVNAEWQGSWDRAQGIFANFNNGVLLEGNFFDLNGYELGFTGQDASSPQPPTMYSHNMYIGNDNTDITLRDSISMRASSFGAQVRPGGFIEDNVFIDNNAAFATVGGDYKDAGYVGYYSLLSGNIVTSGAHKDADMVGAFTLGLTDDALMTSLVDNVVAHLANPDDPSELDYKYWINDANRSIDPYYNDTIVWNWMGARAFEYPDKDVDVNVEGLDPSVMDATTIQRFTAQLLGTNEATIGDLADYLRAQADGTLDDVVDADLIIKFFQEGFGIEADMRDGAETLRFIPNDLGDGVRWDNHLNWSTDDLPGLYAEDDVDLGGNHVVFGTNATIDELEFGPDGELQVYGGKLTVAGGVTGDYAGSLDITSAGQFWTEGGDAANLDIDVMGGRFVNTGAMSGADLSVTGGQAILATDNAEFDVESGDKLSISGAGRAGFDGEDGGMAILDMHAGSTLEFLTEGGDLGSISEFRSGAFGDSDVKSGADLGDTNLTINLAGLSASAGSAFTLMEVDEIIGLFDEASVSGLGSRDATIVVDYETDTVTLKLASGSGKVAVQTVGGQDAVSAGHEDLWDALVSGQGVVSETAQAMLPDDEEDALLDAA
ncbi:hypothetical protein EF888_16030 [Silicimonas algicola]|nr:hypothetical protein EF888_16030 [Silicimonas algicola]